MDANGQIEAGARVGLARDAHLPFHDELERDVAHRYQFDEACDRMAGLLGV
jgi:hypothetical protein